MNYKDFKGYRNVTAMKNEGWTDEEIAALANAPRSREASFDEEGTFFRWPAINGVSTVGLFSVLNRKEKDAYNKYHKHHGSSSSGAGVKVDDELLKKYEAFKEELIKLKVKQELVEMFEALVPKKPDAEVEKAVKALIALGYSEEEARKMASRKQQ